MLKYQEIVRTLVADIRAGKYMPGDYLPPERELGESFGVSRITIKRAMDELVTMGLVIKRRGAGTMIKALPTANSDRDVAGQFTGFTKAFEGRRTSTVVRRFVVIHPVEEVADKLQISVEDFVYDIERLRILDDQPMVLEYTQMPIAVIPSLRQDTLEKSIYNFIENDLSLKIQSAHRSVRAAMPTEEEQEALGIEGVMPVLEVEQVAFLSDGRPFEYSVSRHRADKVTLHSISVR